VLIEPDTEVEVVQAEDGWELCYTTSADEDWTVVTLGCGVAPEGLPAPLVVPETTRISIARVPSTSTTAMLPGS
jgi:hypothetical protein